MEFEYVFYMLKEENMDRRWLRALAIKRQHLSAGCLVILAATLSVGNGFYRCEARRRQQYDSEIMYERVRSVIEAHIRDDVDVDRIIRSVERGLPDVITSEDLDKLVAEKTAELAFVHPSYDVVAGKIEMGILTRSTPSTFSGSCDILGMGPNPILSARFMEDLVSLRQYLDHIVERSCRFSYTYSSMKAMEKTYLLKKDGKVVERPHYMFMRVALHLHRNDIVLITKTYELLIHHAYIHATPTMANAGTVGGQLSSCFLVSLGHPNTTAGLYRTLAQAAEISTSAGGIGIDFTSCPSVGATDGDKISLGLPPVLQLFEASLAVNVNGQSRRPSAITGYIEPWHPDIFTVINMRRNRSNIGGHLRNLFQAIWIPDVFMARVHNDAPWSLFSPHLVPLLEGCFGPAFDAKYVAYEMDTGIDRVTVPARSVMDAIIQAQVETGGPFILYKDAVNFKNNQANLGTITHSNLCTEIVQYSSPMETAVCNLASLVLPSYVRDDTFDLAELYDVVKTVTHNLNRVIDRTICPSEESSRGNHNQRAIGIGIQGLADAFIALGFPYQSRRAKRLNREIIETIHHAAMTASVEFARDHGCYPSYAGSPLSKGRFQHDLWHVLPTSNLYDWDALREDIATYGVANSLLVALMPTSGTSQITGCTESFEPIQTNIFSRHVLSGEYRVLSPALVQCLTKEDLWSENMRIKIVRSQGSIQDIEEIPTSIKAVFKTAWEIGPQAVIDLAVDRAPFVCQSQSLTLCMENPTPNDLLGMHFYTWRSGLKTGLYYLRTRPAARPIQVTVPFTFPREIATAVSASSSSSTSSSSSSSTSLHLTAILGDEVGEDMQERDGGIVTIESEHTSRDVGTNSNTIGFLQSARDPLSLFSPYCEDGEADALELSAIINESAALASDDSPFCDSCGA